MFWFQTKWKKSESSECFEPDIQQVNSGLTHHNQKELGQNEADHGQIPDQLTCFTEKRHC